MAFSDWLISFLPVRLRFPICGVGGASFQEKQTAVSVLVARLWVCRAGLRLAGQELFVPSIS